MGNPGRVIETQFNRCIKGEVKLISNRTKKFELPIDKNTTLDSIPNLEELVASHLGIDVLDIVSVVNMILNGGINSPNYTQCELENANYNGVSINSKTVKKNEMECVAFPSVTLMIFAPNKLVTVALRLTL